MTTFTFCLHCYFFCLLIVFSSLLLTSWPLIIKGDIDGVESTITVTWVLPRVLDTPQMHQLKAKLTGWSSRVGATLTTVEDLAAEIISDC